MVRRRLQFISLDNVLRAIATHTDLPDWVRLVTPDGSRLVTSDDPDSLRNPCEEAVRYSKAASLLHHHLEMTNDPSHPRWLDYRGRRTGFPRPRDVAREDGIAFLVEEAEWYWKWEEFDKNFRIRKMEVDASSQIPSLNGGGLSRVSLGNRWHNLGLTAADYARECPQRPINITQYFQLVEDLVFDLADIVAFLDCRGIPHPLAPVEHPGADPTPNPSDAPIDEQSESIGADVRVQSTDTGILLAEPSAKASWGNRTATTGRKSLIEKAILRAQALAGQRGDDVDAVFSQLVTLASECPPEFHPLSGYKNGQVMYWDNGHERPYKKTALAAFLRRKRDARSG